MRTPRRLNDLSGTEWLPATRSAFVDGVGDPQFELTWDRLENGSTAVLSTATARPLEKRKHPATFPESDARRLVRLFTQKGGSVLDPFLGTGSTALACIAEGRRCLGFELYDKWAKVARERVGKQQTSEVPIEIRTSDALEGVSELNSESQHFILTSPPYWSILKKKDHKARKERETYGFDTEYGDHPQDLSLIESYDRFLKVIGEHFSEWYRVVTNRGYVAVVVSDFRHGSRYYPFHAHIADQLEKARFTLQGMIIIVQNNKRLYPYGFPTSYVPNICNQFVIIGRKL